MKRTWVVLYFPAMIAAFPTHAYSDERGLNAFSLCTLRHNIDPSHMTKEDLEVCLAETGVPDPGEELRVEKNMEFRNCIMASTVRFDDGLSPVSDIAKAIMPLCVKEWEAVVEALWLTQPEKKIMSKDMDKFASPIVIRGILATRKIIVESGVRSPHASQNDNPKAHQKKK